MGGDRRFPLTEEELANFAAGRLVPLREKEGSLPERWRRRFRIGLPFYGLLDEPQQRHLRRLFEYRLPDLDVELEHFDDEERIRLDVLAETYLAQVADYAEIAAEHGYGLVRAIDRRTPSRFAALTLSGSIYVLDAPDERGKRAYTYRNIYHNRSIPPEGSCRLKADPAAGERLRTLSFKSSPIQLLAGDRARVRRPEFRSEATILSDMMARRARRIRSRGEKTLIRYLGGSFRDEEGSDVGPPPDPGGQ